jgi:hypothetical protein
MAVKVIAVIWDFDKSLIRGYMQEPLFKHYGVEPVEFWDEVNALGTFHGAGDEHYLASEFLYLNHMLTYVRHGRFEGLDNQMLRRFGTQQDFAPGIPDIFERLESMMKRFAREDIQLEHYVISTGLRQVILGSVVAPWLKDVWACEFLTREAPPGFLKRRLKAAPESIISDIGYVIDHTTKTRALFEINKGVRALGMDVNARIPQKHRRVPFANMIYLADGPSDIPSFSVVNQHGGRTFGVYQPNSPRDLAQAEMLLAQQRVEAIGPADYSASSFTTHWLIETITSIAERLRHEPAPRVEEYLHSQTPGHIYKPE